MARSRFLHPYYVLNSALCVAFLGLRTRHIDTSDLSNVDMFGISREMQIYICLFLMLISRALSAPTLDAYLSSAFMFARVAILVVLWYMDHRFAGIFAALWTLLYAVCPQPRYRLPESIATLNHASFNDRITRNKHKTIYVLWCHATWSARCSQLLPVLAKLAKGYAHPRIRFARLDMSKYPSLAGTLGVSVSPASKQLPTIICFKQGKEVSRIPTVDGSGNIPKEWSRGFTAAHIAKALDLKTHYATAKQWEKDAQSRYEAQQKKKDN